MLNGASFSYLLYVAALQAKSFLPTNRNLVQYDNKNHGNQ